MLYTKGISHPTMIACTALSGLLMGATGDQSLGEAMSLKEQIIHAIKNTFEINDLTKLPAININGLPELIKLLNDQTVPKIIQQNLESIILDIRLKQHPTPIEKKFLKQVQELVYKPLDEGEPDHSSLKLF
ncbi:MAG TPA: hypothetical protein PK657_04525 [Legionella sp.]|nr:hypothetical protein [Legionella sp.]